MTILNFLLLVELVLLGCMLLGVGLAWIIYRQYPDEPFHMFFVLFWRDFFRRHLDVSADPKAIRSSTKAIALEGGDESAAVDHWFGAGDGLDEEAAMKRSTGDPSGVATLEVKVVPGASRDQISGRYADGIKVQVTAAPEGGDANRAVIQLLADALGVKVYQIQLLRGHYRPQKTVKISGMNQAQLDARIAQLT